jgi:hypothetical protein
MADRSSRPAVWARQSAATAADPAKAGSVSREQWSDAGGSREVLERIADAASRLTRFGHALGSFEICRRLFHFTHFLIKRRSLPIG